MKLTKRELDHLWHTSCPSFLSRNEANCDEINPINKTWAEILKKEKSGTFFLHWCESLIDAKTVVCAYKIKYYDILIDASNDKIEYIIWCKKDLSGFNE